MAARGSNIHVSLSLFLHRIEPNTVEKSSVSIKYRMFIFESREEEKNVEKEKKKSNKLYNKMYITSTSSKLEIYNQNTSIK